MPKEKETHKKKQVEERRHALDDAKKEEMIATLLRNEAAFSVVKDMLTVGHVRQISDWLGLIWRTAAEYRDTYEKLPSKAAIRADIHNALKANSGLVDEDDLGKIDEFLDHAWDSSEQGKAITKTNSPAAKAAINTCKQFLEEIAALELREGLLRDGTLPASLPQMLEGHRTRLDLVESLTDVEIDVPFPENWDKRKQVKLFSTGVDVLDMFTGGGWRGKEVVLFMGPYGSCKTTVVMNGIGNMIRTAATLYNEGKSKKNKKGKAMVPLIVLIFTESDKDEYRARLMSAMARVRWDRLSAMESLDDLDDSNKPGSTDETKYEKAEFKKDKTAGTPFLSERERVIKAAKLANKHLLMIDCTDSEDSQHQIGKGGITEIANIVRSELRRRKGCYPLSFWVDHVSALADRMAEADSSHDDKLHLILKRLPRQAADKLAKPYNAPVMLMHQLSGEANSRRVTSKFHHSDAAGSKSIGEYVNFAIVTGPTDDEGLCKWECTKHRRTSAHKHRVIRVIGQFNRVIDEPDYVIDFGRGRIVPKQEMELQKKYDTTKKSISSSDYAGAADM